MMLTPSIWAMTYIQRTTYNAMYAPLRTLTKNIILTALSKQTFESCQPDNSGHSPISRHPPSFLLVNVGLMLYDLLTAI